jgi:hypothetical protein
LKIGADNIGPIEKEITLTHGQLVFLAGLLGAEVSKLQTVMEECDPAEEKAHSIHRNNFGAANDILSEVKYALALAEEDMADRE